MNGQKLLNNTLKVNAGFSFLSGLDFILFDKPISGFVYATDPESLAPMGFMLIVFAIFVFAVSMMRNVNKYLVGSIIFMDTLWVIGSGLLIATSSAVFSGPGIVAILSVALIIATFALLQGMGLRMYQKEVRS